MSNIIPNVENRIILSTLEYGAKHGVANVSTIEVAALADVSEYTIFKHFNTKKGLLTAAAEFCDERIANWSLNAASESNNIEEFWDKAISKIEECPNAVIYYYRFIAYFGFNNFKRRRETYVSCGQALLGNGRTEEEYIRYWDYITTLIYLYFSKVSEGYLSFSDKDMAVFKKLIFEGLNNF